MAIFNICVTLFHFPSPIICHAGFALEKFTVMLPASEAHLCVNINMHVPFQIWAPPL